MSLQASRRRVEVRATVEEVLPQFGLAYAVGEDGKTWGLTRKTSGIGLDRLRAGQKVSLSIEQVEDYFLASGYALLD